MTRTQILGTMEAAQLQRYHAAYPHMTALLSQMSEEDCKKALNSSEGKGTEPSIRSRVFERMMEPFLPPSYKQHGHNLTYNQGRAIEGMSVRAAAGMVAAVKKGYLSDNLTWLTIYRDYPSIVAVAKRHES